MSHKKVYRKDKTCLNCRHVVEHKFCPNCGQENIDTRKTFYHLFVHFFEDLTHYENAFWKTLKNLVLKPAALTKEYLSGKRLSYLAPIRLYIFISFFTFFAVAIFGGADLVKLNDKSEFVDDKKADSLVIEKLATTINSKTKEAVKKEKLLQIINDERKRKAESKARISLFGIKSIQQLDSIQKFGKESSKFGIIGYWLTKKMLQVREKNTDRELIEKGLHSAAQNIPKVLIIYMPFFAFFLWLFHGKKRWYYFDHGIYTLHYFSFLLIMVFLLSMLSALEKALISHIILQIIFFIIQLGGSLWMFYYFFSAHYRFYGESRLTSFLKSASLLIINLFFVSIFLVLFFLYTVINIK